MSQTPQFNINVESQYLNISVCISVETYMSHLYVYGTTTNIYVQKPIVVHDVYLLYRYHITNTNADCYHHTTKLHMTTYVPTSTPTTIGRCGLQNFGNTCFLASLIQLLSASTDVVKACREDIQAAFRTNEFGTDEEQAIRLKTIAYCEVIIVVSEQHSRRQARMFTLNALLQVLLLQCHLRKLHLLLKVQFRQLTQQGLSDLYYLDFMPTVNENMPTVESCIAGSLFFRDSCSTCLHVNNVHTTREEVSMASVEGDVTPQQLLDQSCRYSRATMDADLKCTRCSNIGTISRTVQSRLPKVFMLFARRIRQGVGGSVLRVTNRIVRLDCGTLLQRHDGEGSSNNVPVTLTAVAFHCTHLRFENDTATDLQRSAHGGHYVSSKRVDDGHMKVMNDSLPQQVVGTKTLLQDHARQICGIMYTRSDVDGTSYATLLLLHRDTNDNVKS